MDHHFDVRDELLALKVKLTDTVDCAHAIVRDELAPVELREKAGHLLTQSGGVLLKTIEALARHPEPTPGITMEELFALDR